MAEPSRVAVDEIQIEVDAEDKWLYAAVDTGSKFLLEIEVYNRRGIVPRRRFTIVSLRYTKFQTLNFRLMAVAT